MGIAEGDGYTRRGWVYQRTEGIPGEGQVYQRSGYTRGASLCILPEHGTLDTLPQHNTYGRQAGGTHPTGMLSCIVLQSIYMRTTMFILYYKGSYTQFISCSQSPKRQHTVKQECIPVGCTPCSNHACPPPRATMHAPQEQPCMPPGDRCKNITFANYVCGRQSSPRIKGTHSTVLYHTVTCIPHAYSIRFFSHWIIIVTI